MDGILKMFVTPESIIFVGPVLLLFVFVAYKEWPDLRNRFSASLLKEQEMQAMDESLANEIQKLRDEIHRIKDEFSGEIRELNDKTLCIQEKLSNDFSRINRLERENDQIRKLAENSLEERRILMECSLAQLDGLQQLGANGPTKAAAMKLHEYLNQKAHNL